MKRMCLAAAAFAIAGAIGGAAVQEVRVRDLRREMAYSDLRSNWDTARMLLSFVNGRPVWTYDPTDPDQSGIVQRAQRFTAIIDPDGNLLQGSGLFRQSGLRVPSRNGFEEVRQDGIRYLLYSATLREEGRSYRLIVCRRSF